MTTIEKEVVKLKKEMKSFVEEMKSITLKGADQTDEDASRFDDLESKVDEHEKRIAKCEKVMKLESEDNNQEPDENVEMGAPSTDGYPMPAEFKGNMMDYSQAKSFNIGWSKERMHREKGKDFFHFVIGQTFIDSKKYGSGFAKTYINDVVKNKGVAKALFTGSQASGGALIPQVYKDDFIDLCYAEEVMTKGGALIVNMANGGNLTWPRVAGGITAQWQGEIDDIGVTQPVFDDIQFSAKKLTALVPVSNDLIRRSPISVETIVRANMVMQSVLARDISFITADGTLQNPVGLQNLIISQNVLYTAASPHYETSNGQSGGSALTGQALLEDILLTLNGFEYALRGNNVPMGKAAWIANPSIRSYLASITDGVGRAYFRDELNAGKLLGYPFFETTQLPNNLGTSGNVTNLFFVAMDQCVIAECVDMFVDSSSEASYVQNGQVINAYSRDQTLFRTISECDFNMQHIFGGAVGALGGWAPNGATFTSGISYASQPLNTTPSSAGSANPK